MTAPCTSQTRMQTTSFQKKSRGKTPQIPGARPSLHNGQLLVSTGVPSLDFVVGGGLAVGSVLLIEEDVYGSYSQILLRYFLAEGVVTGHALFLASADEQPEKLLQNLPCPVEEDPVRKAAEMLRTNEGAVHDEDRMKIAWRYEHLPKHQSNPSSHRFGHFYDLSKTMSKERLETVPCKCIFIKDDVSQTHSLCQRMFKDIESYIKDEGYSLLEKQTKERNILRLALHSIASPLWGEELTGNQGAGFCQFLHALRSLMRNSLAVCILTVPTHLFQDAVMTRRIEKLCDSVIQLESFAGSEQEKNPIFKEYHGLFHIRQLPRLNSLTAHMPDSSDLAFKLRRKKLTVEKLHLPPEFGDLPSSRSQTDTIQSATAPSVGCGSSTGRSKLDF